MAASNSDSFLPPMFLSSLFSQTYLVGDSLLLECNVVGSPDPELTWTCDGCDCSSDFSCSYNGRLASLCLKDVRVGNTGLYECRAQNSCGSALVNARIHVHREHCASFVLIVF